MQLHGANRWDRELQPRVGRPTRCRDSQAREGPCASTLASLTYLRCGQSILYRCSHTVSVINGRRSLRAALRVRHAQT